MNTDKEAKKRNETKNNIDKTDKNANGEVKNTEEEAKEINAENVEVLEEEPEQQIGEEDGLLSLEEQEKLVQEKNEYKDRLIRLQAEFENYKKRISNEREKDKKYGAESIMKCLVPVLDNFERALANFEEKTSEEDEVYQGIKMIYDQLMDVLVQNGLVRIEAEGNIFDPNYHEAVMMVEDEKYSKNVVVEELQTGYMLHDKLLRASMVKVAK